MARDMCVLVTGASSGIGAEVARAFAGRGARVAVAARRLDRLESLADEIGGVAIAADLSRPGEPRRLAAEAVRALGRVDVLVNNAGTGVGGTQWRVGDTEAGREVFETNVWAPAALVAELVPDMRARGHGAVVNVTSMSQVMTWPMLGHYAASKAALAMLTETLRLELTGSGVHVVEVVPGPVDTAVQGETRVIPGISRALRGVRLGDPAELARLVVRAVERPRPTVVYPRPMRLAYAVPGLVRRFIRRQVRSAVPTDVPVVLRSGSKGDELARLAREAWDRGERDLSGLQERLTRSP